ncbi:pentapeptide repeat-containing protein [Peribacillus frigoritolerans]|nr:pentapeptide repeat-containing protein [Peribacillus frigoritolerans]
MTFSDVSFRNIELTDVIFDHCDLTNADFMGGSIHRVEFKRVQTFRH